MKLRRTPYLKTGNCEQLLHKRFARATVAGPLWVKDPPRYLFNLRTWLSVSSPLRSVGTPSPLPRGSCSFKPGNNLEPCTDSLELCRRVLHLRKSEQRKFGYQQTRPNGTLVLSSYSTYIRMLVTWLLFRSRARVVLGSELRLLMSFSWPVFSGLDQDLFPPPWFSSFFGIRFQNGAKECIV